MGPDASLLPRSRTRHWHSVLLGCAVAACCLLLPPTRAQEPDTDAAAALTPPWLREIANTIQTSYAQGQRMAEERLVAAREAKNPIDEAYALIGVAWARSRANDLPAAVRAGREALTLAEKQNDPLLILNACHTYGRCLSSSGRYAEATEYFLRNLRLAEQRKSVRAEAMAISDLAHCYSNLGDHVRALEYSRRTLALVETFGDADQLAGVAHNVGNHELSLGNTHAARTQYTRALELRRTLTNRTAIADELDALAGVDVAEGKYAEALKALEPVMANRRTLRGKLKLTASLLIRAEALQKVGRLDEALQDIEEARSYIDTIERPKFRAQVYERLASIQEAKGNFAAALAATRREFKERELMTGEVAQAKMIELQGRYDLVKKDDEIARLARENETNATKANLRAAQLAQSDAELRAKEAELSRAQSQRLAYGLGAVAVAAIFGAILFVQRTRIRAERQVLADTRAARDAAQEADALKSRLLAFASHDLKSPLATLSGAADLLHDAANDPHEVKSLAVAMRSESARMIHLVHDFLDRLALESGKLELRTQPVDLAQVATRIVADFLPRASQKKQTLTLAVPPAPLPAIAGEMRRLEQVLANLVSNALKYTPCEGTVRVVLGGDSQAVWCEVQDTGPGISRAEQEKLFQPFSRLSPRPTGGESSSGLGLYLARELVALHRGTLTVESAPGAGSKFRVTLPPM